MHMKLYLLLINSAKIYKIKTLNTPLILEKRKNKPQQNSNNSSKLERKNINKIQNN